MPQGKHRKTVLEGPAGVLQKREGSLSEACAVSLPLCLWLTPPHTCTQAVCSQSPLGAPCASWSLGLEEEYPRAQPKSDDTGSLGGPMGPARLQGLREMTEWDPSGQAGGAMEDVLPEILGDPLIRKEVRHPEPR